MKIMLYEHEWKRKFKSNKFYKKNTTLFFIGKKIKLQISIKKQSFLISPINLFLKTFLFYFFPVWFFILFFVIQSLIHSLSYINNNQQKFLIILGKIEIVIFVVIFCESKGNINAWTTNEHIHRHRKLIPIS